MRLSGNGEFIFIGISCMGYVCEYIIGVYTIPPRITPCKLKVIFNFKKRQKKNLNQIHNSSCRTKMASPNR